MTTSSSEQEKLKHRNRLKEIVLDKLVLALIVLIAGFAFNHRLSQYENSLDAQLEKLKAAYNLDRILYEREIEAHENTWKAVIAFRQATRTHFGHTFDEERNNAMKSSAAELISIAEFESLYLTPEAEAQVKRLYLEQFPEFRRKWREDDKGTEMSKETWNWWAGEIDEVGREFAELIQSKRQTALKSEPRTTPTESTVKHSSKADG